MMEVELSEVLNELERVAARLDGTAPADLETMEGLLSQRAAAVGRLQQLVACRSHVLSPATLDRLGAVMQGGLRLREKLMLAKAELRHELTGLYQTAFLVRALAAGEPAKLKTLDCTV